MYLYFGCFYLNQLYIDNSPNFITGKTLKKQKTSIIALN